MNLMMAVHMSMRGDCSQKQEHCVSGYTIKEDTSSPSTHSFRGPPSVSLWTSWAPFSCTMRWWAWPCTVLVEVTKASVNWCMQQTCHVQTGLELYVVKDNLELTLQPPAPTSTPPHTSIVLGLYTCATASNSESVQNLKESSFLSSLVGLRSAMENR